MIITTITASSHSVQSNISLDDAYESSGDEPNDRSDPVLQDLYTQQETNELIKKEGLLANKIIKKRNRKRIKSRSERKEQGHINDQTEQEVKKNPEEEKRGVYEEEELRIEKELKKEKEDEDQYEGNEEEEDILRGDVFRMSPRFPGPDPSVETPPLPTGCSVLDNTLSCNNVKLTQIPPIMDAELTSIELVGKAKVIYFTNI